MATYDIAVLGDPEQSRSLLDFDNTMNTGIYKLVQRVMILLLRDSSSPESFGSGTELPQQIRSANITDIEILKGLFNIAAEKVREQIVVSTFSDAPADEVLDRISVDVTQNERDGLTAEVTVLSTAGTEATVSIPISDTSALAGT
jgi:hypothetical protein